MPTLKNVINQASRGADLYFVFRFLRLLTMKYTSTEAYKLGIIDKKGKALKKSSELETVKEKASYTMLHRLVFKIRGLIEKIPVIGKSILLNYAAALFLLKEQKDTRIWTDDVYMKTKLLEFLETDWEADAKLLKEEVDNMGHKSFKSFLTEAPLFRGKEPLYDKDDGTQEKWMKEIEKGINAPYVSVGKSAIGLTLGRYISSMPNSENVDFSPGTYFLTTQKILQDQYVDDFGKGHGCMKSIKSSSNYKCTYHKKNTCQESQQLLRTTDKIWRKMGCEQDAVVVVDSSGFPYMGAGMNASARDLARFGQLLINDGYYNGQQIVPSQFIKDTRNGNDTLRSHFKKNKKFAGLMGGNGHYHNQTWCDRDSATLACIGIYGQTIWDYS